MAVNVETTTISNIGKQSVRVVYSVGNPKYSASTVPQTKAGLLDIQPGKSATIESARINPEQLRNLANQGLIKYSTSKKATATLTPAVDPGISIVSDS